jgi:hypothetical protein
MKNFVKIVGWCIVGKFVFLPMLQENRDTIDYFLVMLRSIVEQFPF